MKIHKATITPIILCISLLFFFQKVQSQGQFTNMGKDFLLAFYSNNGNAASNTNLFLELKIVAPQKTHVKITYHLDNTIEEFEINAEQVYSYVLNPTQREKVYYNSTPSTPDKRSMQIETDNGVTVYAINMYSNTTDGTAVFPINNYGKEYINVGVPGSGCMIIATEDNTKVTINTTQYMLNKFQVLRNGTDSRGKKITADKPIAVFNNHSCSNWPSGACDHQWEQLVPIPNFGKEFFIPKTNMSSETMCIVADNTTTVSYQIGTAGTVNKTVSPGTVLEIPFTADTYLTADKPIGMTTHIGGTQAIPGHSNGGDPSTAWVPPIEQDITSAYITPFRGGSSVIKADYALIVTKTINKSYTTVNSLTPAGTWKDHPSGYSSIIINLPSMVAYTILNPKGMIVMAYGVGGSESYYYLAASSARKLDASFTINGTHYQDANLSVPFDCGSPFNFKATIQYDLSPSAGKIKWFVDGVEETAARDRAEWTKSYLPAGNHKVELWITDIRGEVEKLETTLKVECATDMIPKTATVYEGDQVKMTIQLGAGSTPTNMVFTLSADAGTTALPADYSFPATVTIPAGSDKVEFYVTTTANNVINEPDKLLKLKAKTSGNPDMIATITIKDKATTDQTTLSITADPLIINEPHTGHVTTPNATAVKVQLPEGVTSKTAINVTLSYTGSTATLTTDYTLNPSTVSANIVIPANQQSASFTLTALEDLLVEGDELVKVTATAPAGYSMKTGSDKVSITLKDKTPGDIVVQKQEPANPLNASEPNTHGKFRIGFGKSGVIRTKPTKVTFTLAGEAINQSDYELIIGSTSIPKQAQYEATIPTSTSFVDVQIKVKDNYIVQGERDVIITVVDVE